MMFTKNLSGFTRCISLLLMLMVMGVMDLQAQTSEITGVVRSSEGETIPGVTVMLKGSGTGTSTDMDGAYKLTVNDPNGTLMFSSIGMIKQEIPINGRSTIDVTMEMDVAQLDMVEVVDYGYGTVKKTDMTGSVASMSGKELAKIPVASAAQAITGRLPGVRVLDRKSVV